MAAVTVHLEIIKHMPGTETDNQPAIDPLCDEQEHWSQSWDIRRSIRYHSARQAFFEDLSRVIMGLNILLSTSAATSLIAEADKKGVGWLLFFIALINVVDLVVGTSKAAWLHRDLKSEFINLERKYFLNNNIPKSKLEKAKSLRLLIETKEPPIFRTLDLVCHNQLVEAINWSSEDEKKSNLKPVCWLKYIFRNFYRY